MKCSFIIKIIISSIIIGVLLCCIEYGIYKIFWYILFKKFIFGFLVCFILNYLLIRITAIHCIFEWQFPFQTFNLYYESRKIAKNLKIVFKELKSSLLSLEDPNNILIKSEIENIKEIFKKIESLIFNYQEYIHKYGNISTYQNNFYEKLIVLKDIFKI